tara:strand:- start:358 stop:1035 length:678 start_codon:yes stop_codon:yes gene_type:complete
MQKNKIYLKDYRDIIKDLDKEKTLIITDPPYNVGWKYKTYKDKVSEEEYREMFKCFKGFRFVVIHYIEDIINYIVPNLGVPSRVVQWIYNSQMARQSRSIAFFNCTPDFSKVKQPYKNLTDKRILQKILNGSEGCNLYDWWNIDIVKNVSKEKEDYYNQIPEKVIGNIIKIVANDGDLIYDPFLGSGTTAAVAYKLGYDYIGTDICEKAIDVSTNRLNKICNTLI